MDLLSECTSFSESAKRPFIFRLPNELLQKIFGYIFDMNDSRIFSARITRDSLVALSRTCQRFYPSAQHVLYQSPCFGGSMNLHSNDNDSLIRSFHQKLKDSPNIRSLCKRFSIQVCDDGYGSPRLWPWPDLRFANELLLLMTNLTHLNVTAYFNYSETWSAINGALKHMRFLQQLALRVINWEASADMGPPLRRICRDMELPSLHVLELDCATTSFDLGYEDESKGWFRGTELIPIEKHNAGAFISLHIVMPNRSSRENIKRGISFDLDSLKELLTWPKALEHLSLDPTQKISGLDDIQKSLQPVRKTLKSLNLGPVGPPMYENSVLDLNDFEELESLHIQFHDLYLNEANPHQEGSPELAAASLCGPRLRSLTLDYRIDPRAEEDPFGDNRAHWIRTFSHCARAKGSSLSNITLLLSPSTAWGRDSNCQASPLKLLELFGTLDRLKDDCRDHGIEFHYRGPYEGEFRAGFRVLKIR